MGQETGLGNVKGIFFFFFFLVMERVKPLTRMLRQRRREVWLPPQGPLLRSILLPAPSAAPRRSPGTEGGGCRPPATLLRKGPCPGAGTKPPGLGALCRPASASPDTPVPGFGDGCAVGDGLRPRGPAGIAEGGPREAGLGGDPGGGWQSGALGGLVEHTGAGRRQRSRLGWH